MATLRFVATDVLVEYHGKYDFVDGVTKDVEDKEAIRLLTDFPKNFVPMDGGDKLDALKFLQAKEEANKAITEPMVLLRFLPNPTLTEYHGKVDFYEFNDEREVPYSIATELITNHPKLFKPLQAYTVEEKLAQLQAAQETQAAQIIKADDDTKSEKEFIAPSDSDGNAAAVSIEDIKPEDLSPGDTVIANSTLNAILIRLLSEAGEQGLKLSELSKKIGIGWTKIRGNLTDLISEGKLTQEGDVYKIALES